MWTTTAFWTFKLESKAKTPSLVTSFGDSYSHIRKGMIIKKRNIIYVSSSMKTCSCKIFIKDQCIIFSYIYCTLYHLLQVTLYPTVISLIQFHNLLNTLLYWCQRILTRNCYISFPACTHVDIPS